MKSNPPYLLIAVIFIVVILYSAFVSSNPMVPTSGPFHPTIRPYEGFHSRSKPLEYSTSVGQHTIDSHTSHLMNQTTNDCRKIGGFDGLICSPEVPEHKIDIFSHAQGSLECTGSGLTNSKGSLCLDKTMTDLLMTRGGNSTGRDSEIGQ
jgi:hypothetical protein